MQNLVHACYLSMLKTIHKANATVSVFARLVTNQRMEHIMSALLQHYWFDRMVTRI